MKTLLPILAACLAAIPSARASDLKEPSTGISFPMEKTVGGTTFRCLGAGVRKVLVFKAYAAAFCLEKSQALAVPKAFAEAKYPALQGDALAEALQRDPAFFEALMAAPGDKLVILRTVRDIPREKMADAFRDGLAGVLSPDRIETLVAAIPGDIAEGDSALIYSSGSRLTIDVGGRRQTLEDAETARKLWGVWLGKKSVAPSLKSSIAHEGAGR